MKNIHEPAVLSEITGRINKLSADSRRQWGKMNVAQMMAHLSTALETNMGDRATKQSFIGKIFGKMAKKSVVSDKPFKQGLPTDPSFVITDSREFGQERQRLLGLVARLSKSAPDSYAKNPHPFFGRLSPHEWNMLNYKHLDHHLRQFGV